MTSTNEASLLPLLDAIEAAIAAAKAAAEHSAQLLRAMDSTQ